MRCVALALVLLACSLGACEQGADVVLRLTEIPSQTPQAGMSGDGDGDGDGDDGPLCDVDPASVLTLSAIERNDCEFRFTDGAAVELLTMHIFSQPRPPRFGEDEMFGTCGLADNIASPFDLPLPFELYQASSRDGAQFAQGVATLCPPYCRLLRTWLDEHASVGQQCDGGT